MNRHSLAVLIWLLAVTAATLVHRPGVLAAAALLAVGFSGPRRLALLGQAVRMVGPVVLVLVGGQVVIHLVHGQPDMRAPGLLATRLLLIAVLTAWMIRSVDLARALAPWPAAARWLVIARGQFHHLQQLAGDSRLAQRSRLIDPPRLRDRYRGSAAIALAVLDRAVDRATTVTQALRSRGALE